MLSARSQKNKKKEKKGFDFSESLFLLVVKCIRNWFFKNQEVAQVPITRHILHIIIIISKLIQENMEIQGGHRQHKLFDSIFNFSFLCETKQIRTEEFQLNNNESDEVIISTKFQSHATDNKDKKVIRICQIAIYYHRGLCM